MYYLDQKQFMPEMILLGIPFVPCIIGLVIANILLFKIELLICLLIILATYLTIVFILWKLSKRTDHYILLRENKFELVYHDSLSGKTQLELPFEQVINIKYYRISSMRGWLMLYSYVLPKCVYITYRKNDEVQTKFIGYLDFIDIIEIANIANIELRIH